MAGKKGSWHKPYVIIDGVSHKTCSKCKRLLPVTDEFFGRYKNGRDGYTYHCKECRGYGFGIRKSLKPGYKICTSCLKELPATPEYFNRSKHVACGLNAICKKCYSSKRRKLLSRDKEKNYALNREYHRNNREKINERRRKYYGTEHGKMVINLKDNRRKYTKRSLPSDFTVERWEDVVNKFNGECAYCGKKDYLTHDHFVPVSRGGEYTKNNIIPSCISCNSSKKNSDFSDWYPKQEFYSKKREQKILTYLGYKNGIQQLALL